jgi:hypothetical protein
VRADVHRRVRRTRGLAPSRISAEVRVAVARLTAYRCTGSETCTWLTNEISLRISAASVTGSSSSIGLTVLRAEIIAISASMTG